MLKWMLPAPPEGERFFVIARARAQETPMLLLAGW